MYRKVAPSGSLQQCHKIGRFSNSNLYPIACGDRGDRSQQDSRWESPMSGLVKVTCHSQGEGGG